MSGQESYEPKTETIKAQVIKGFDEARQFAKTLDYEEVKSGEWFVELLRKVVYAYDRNARAEYFQQKYPGLSPDEIADILTSVTVRYAAVAGGVAGAAATSTQLTTLTSFGMTAPLFVSAIGAEMVYLARIQMRLVLDLSVVYDLQLDPEDPEDVLMVFGYALGVAPTNIIATGAGKAAGEVTKRAVKKYISKDVLKAVQNFARKLGFKILQRTILKYAVPIASAAVGGSYNYVATKSMGEIAKTHFKNRGKFTAELQKLVSRQNTYDLVFPAAALYVAHLDDELSSKERDLYKTILSRMRFQEHTQAEFKKLVEDKANLIETAANIEDEELRRRLLDVLVLMAVCDGELAEKERGFLANIASRLEVPLDLDEVEKKTRDYRMDAKQSMAERATSSARATATIAGGKARGVLGKAFQRKTVDCPNCGSKVLAKNAFCPDCGQAVADTGGHPIVE